MNEITTLVISLEQSTGRRKHICQEMNKLGLKWEFLNAVDGRKLDLSRTPYNASKVKRLTGFELTPNEIGCYLSHIQAWKSCIEANQPTMILEDDFIAEKNLPEAINLLNEHFTNWDLIRLQALFKSKDQTISQFQSLKIVKNTSDPIGATAYLIKPPAAQKLIKHSSEIYEPVDHFLEHHKKHGVNMLAIKPYPATILQQEKSTINDRPEQRTITGWRKKNRSIHRLIDRLISPNPWYPK